MNAVDENMIIDSVDERDTSIGIIRRRDVLRQGANFRVVHILVFNSNGDLLVQRLARTRTRHPGYWGSSVAGYVFAEENYEEAAARRLAEELGVFDAPLQYLGKDTMLDEDSLKFIGVFTTTNNGPFRYDHEHIDSIEFLSLAAIHRFHETGARDFTPTFLRPQVLRGAAQEGLVTPQETGPLSQENLMDLYKIVVDEYRFQVKLNWDRTVYYMVLDTAIISVATGLLKLDSPVLYLLIAAIFLLGVGVAIVGIAAVRKGHQYYRRTVVKKTLLEDLLGLTKPLEGYPGRRTLAFGTTAGQDQHLEVLHDTSRWLERPCRRWSITFWIVTVMKLLAVIDVAGIVASVWLFAHPTQPVPAATPRITVISQLANAPGSDSTRPSMATARGLRTAC